MIYVENNVINLTRGDDAQLEVSLSADDNEPYEMSQTEYLIFGVRETPTDDSELLLDISSDVGSNVIHFAHNDTKDMKVGFYSAEIQLMDRNGNIITVWPKLKGNDRVSKSNRKNFCLMTEVVM